MRHGIAISSAALSTINDQTTARHERKYSNRGLIHQATLGHFFDTLAGMMPGHSCKTVLDFGCGEAYSAREIHRRGVIGTDVKWTGIDLRDDALVTARKIYPDYEFVHGDVFSSSLDQRRFDMVICSQVLEHIHQPEEILARLASLSSMYLLVSVPNEPWFRMCNFLRGRDIFRFGNHPEHINHWSGRSFCRMLQKHVSVVRFCTPFPFLIALCQVRTNAAY